MQASIPILNITWIYQNCLIWEHLNIIKAQCGLRMCCTFVVCPICVAGFMFSLLRLCCGFVMCSICVKLGSPLEFITASHFRRGNLNWGFSNSCRVRWTAFCFNMYFVVNVISWRYIILNPRQWGATLYTIWEAFRVLRGLFGQINPVSVFKAGERWLISPHKISHHPFL